MCVCVCSFLVVFLSHDNKGLSTCFLLTTKLFFCKVVIYIYIYIYVTVCVCVDGVTLRAGGWSLKISLLEPVTDKLGQTRPKAG